MGFFSNLFGGGREAAPPPAEPLPRHRFPSEGAFQSIVGESNYQPAIEAVAGGRTPDGADQFTEAQLVLEDENRYDDQAVRVDIGGRPVGYLSRQDARKYRRVLEELGVGRVIGVCDAWVRGGWDRGPSDRGDFGVLIRGALTPKGATARKRSKPRAPAPTEDADGQPPAGINAAHRARRDMDQLLGLCKGIILDGAVHDTEVTAIEEWLRHHPDVRTTWPADVVAGRIERILADGEITDEERDDLRILLEQVTGSDAETASQADRASTLPLDDPQPAVEWAGRAFCFTGRFYFGSRRACQNAVAERGAVVHDNLRRDTDYLVIGLLGSRDWLHSTHGTKIQKAVQYRTTHGVRIVSEQHWSAAFEGR